MGIVNCPWSLFSTNNYEINVNGKRESSHKQFSEQKKEFVSNHKPFNNKILNGADDPIRTGDPLITSETLWPAELHRLLFFSNLKYNIFRFLNQSRFSGLKINV